MKIRITGIKLIVCLLMLLPVLASGAGKGDSLRAEVLLSKQMLNEIPFTGKFISSFDITPEHHILLSSSYRFYTLGWGGMVPVDVETAGLISSFAFSFDGFLMAIRNDELCSFDSLGTIVKLYNLPGPDMNLASGKYVMYVYGRSVNESKYSLFALARGGKFARLLEFATPIESVAELGNSVLFASGNTVYSYTPSVKELKALVNLPGDRKIISVTTDTLSGRIYFSTENMVFSLKNGQPSMIFDQAGGKLRFYGNSLFVFNPEKNFLVRLSGIEKSLATSSTQNKTVSQPAEEILQNESVIAMAKQGLSEGQIIERINNSRVNFNLSVDAMIELSNNQISSNVIMAMKKAMRNQAVTPK